jgi:hypothetical protein
MMMKKERQNNSINCPYDGEKSKLEDKISMIKHKIQFGDWRL